MIYDGLVKADKDLNYVGAMAESWEFSPDCLELTLKLKRDIKWHDGHPFTAEDVLFTYQAMINPKTPTAYKEDFLAVKSVQAIDPYTVRVRYTRPLAKAVESWGTWMLPKHLLERYVADGKLQDSPQNSRPVGTGPYRFQEWKSGEKVVLVVEQRVLRGPPVPGPHRLPRDPEPGHDLSRAQGQGGRPGLAHRHPVRAADRVPRLPQGVPTSTAIRRAPTRTSAST